MRTSWGILVSAKLNWVQEIYTTSEVCGGEEGGGAGRSWETTGW